ncbi:MAG: UDP-N-acetylglucosamine 2-epimerase (non-hydrolyzing) [Thermanaerothrix sp.]|nr:UDP-N-acetylglucosamine 2-epimerase (non-hydrolyzing) [Thermanaerothrix sp.]
MTFEDINGKKTVVCVVGTRPEAIKMAPVVMALREEKSLNVILLATGQHSQMLYQALEPFGLSPDRDLKVMKERQSLDYVTSSVLCGAGEFFDEIKPHVVLVHGDTTTTMASALAAFYRQIPVGHVEAGLRSGDMSRPFPEEMNRVVTDRISSLFFAPTERSKDNLVKEGILEDRIWITGNTVIDALLWMRDHMTRPLRDDLRSLEGKRFLLVTAHRRESWGEPMREIALALKDILSMDGDLMLLVPMHRNPDVRTVWREILGGHERVLLCEPLDYPDFVWAMDRCLFMLSDSGGVQEEASGLKKPVLILRDVTERPEVLDAGVGFLVGTNRERIVSNASEILEGKKALPASMGSPFGDGRASRVIARVVSEFVGD